jgi:hypothetical protein
MDDPPIPMCKAFEEYMGRLKDDPKRVWDRARGSMVKSLACGCGYCSLACRDLDLDDSMKKNKESNKDATNKNAGLPEFTGDSDHSIDKSLTGRFAPSGLQFSLQFESERSNKEFFVMDRKFCIEKTRSNKLSIIQAAMIQYCQSRNQYLASPAREKLLVRLTDGSKSV